MTQQEKAGKLVKQAPAVTKEEIEQINDLFPHYIFRRSRTGEVWTTCCGRHETLRRTAEVFGKEHQREAKGYYEHAPEPSMLCPFCKRPVIVKELGRTGRRDNLCAYRRAIVIRWHKGALWARGFSCVKKYGSENALTAKPMGVMMSAYRFRPGIAECTVRHGYFTDGPFISISVQDQPLEGGQWHIDNPFQQSYEYGGGYDVIGIEEISKSPFRWCMAEEASHHIDKFVQYLTACCFYPRKIEMLMKAGMEPVVRDLACRGVKHAAVIKWEQEDGKNPFGLNRQELREFLGTNRDIGILELYKKVDKQASITQCAEWAREIVSIKPIADLAKKWEIPIHKMLEYLEKQKPKNIRYTISGVYGLLKDYIDAAQALGYPLHRGNVLLPANLKQAHDSATDKHRDKLAKEASKKRKEEKRKTEEQYAERKQNLEEKYGFAMDGILIRVPESEKEIIDEGRILKHCVAGYADRHMRGKTTILFMRREKKPDTPWLTIEMQNNAMIQIHGYRNEGLYTSEGRFAPDPAQTYKTFLDTWLNWLEAGSKRNKDGSPKIRQKVKEKIA